MKIRNAAGDVEEVDDERGQELVNLNVVAAVGDVPTIEVPSKAIAEQELRWKQAESEYATPQERKQAQVEKDHLERSGNQPRLHETTVPSLAVPDKAHAEAAAKSVAAAEDSLGVGRPAKSAPAVTRPADVPKAKSA